MVTRAQVWYYEHPNRKRRPVLILTRDEHADRQLDAIVVPITGEIRGWDTEIQLGLADGMDRDCVLSVHNTFSAKKIYLTEYMTTLDSVRMTEVCKMLAYATSCPS
jgi:mRNA-degrading endonuclease toxin of MazEF toxin-antitoxin module